MFLSLLLNNFSISSSLTRASPSLGFAPPYSFTRLLHELTKKKSLSQSPELFKIDPAGNLTLDFLNKTFDYDITDGEFKIKNKIIFSKILKALSKDKEDYSKLESYKSIKEIKEILAILDDYSPSKIKITLEDLLVLTKACNTILETIIDRNTSITESTKNFASSIIQQFKSNIEIFINDSIDSQNLQIVFPVSRSSSESPITSSTRFQIISYDGKETYDYSLKNKQELALYISGFKKFCSTQEISSQQQKSLLISRVFLSDIEDPTEVFLLYDLETKKITEYRRSCSSKDCSLFRTFKLLESQLESHSSYQENPLVAIAKKLYLHGFVTQFHDILQKLEIDIDQSIPRCYQRIGDAKEKIAKARKELQEVSATPYGIQVESSDDKILVTRRTSQNNSNVDNSEYIEVQDRAFDNLDDNTDLDLSDITRFYVRVHFKDSGTAEPEISQNEVFYFDKNNNKITLSFDNQSENYIGRDQEFIKYCNIFYGSDKKVNYDVFSPQQNDYVQQFLSQFEATKNRISCRQITKCNDQTTEVKFTPSRNDRLAETPRLDPRISADFSSASFVQAASSYPKPLPVAGLSTSFGQATSVDRAPQAFDALSADFSSASDRQEASSDRQVASVATAPQPIDVISVSYPKEIISRADPETASTESMSHESFFNPLQKIIFETPLYQTNGGVRSDGIYQPLDAYQQPMAVDHVSPEGNNLSHPDSTYQVEEVVNEELFSNVDTNLIIKMKLYIDSLHAQDKPELVSAARRFSNALSIANRKSQDDGNDNYLLDLIALSKATYNLYKSLEENNLHGEHGPVTIDLLREALTILKNNNVEHADTILKIILNNELNIEHITPFLEELDKMNNNREVKYIGQVIDQSFEPGYTPPVPYAVMSPVRYAVMPPIPQPLTEDQNQAPISILPIAPTPWLSQQQGLLFQPIASSLPIQPQFNSLSPQFFSLPSTSPNISSLPTTYQPLSAVPDYQPYYQPYYQPVTQNYTGNQTAMPLSIISKPTCQRLGRSRTTDNPFKC